MKQALRSAGSRITKQRVAILEYLSSTWAHPSAGEVFQEARKKYPEITRATVYNTLGTLVQMGLIKILEFDALHNRYDNNLAPHINLLCTSCGKIQDWEGQVSIHPGTIEEKMGFEVLDYRMEHCGLCAECRARTTKKR